MPKTMKTAVYHGPGKIGLDDVEIPAVPKGFVLVETKVTGICGSTLHRYFGDWERPRLAPGHEFNGIIVGIGEDVGNVKRGNRAATRG